MNTLAAPSLFKTASFDGIQSPLKQMWSLFFEALEVAVQTSESNASSTANSCLSHLWLPRQQTHIHVKQKKSDDFQQELDEQIMCKTFAANVGYPLLYITGEPQPNSYSIMLFPPRYNSRLYPRFSNARFGVVSVEEPALWLIQERRYFRVSKLLNLSQLKHRIPKLDSHLLQQAFARVQGSSEEATKIHLPHLGKNC